MPVADRLAVIGSRIFLFDCDTVNFGIGPQLVFASIRDLAVRTFSFDTHRLPAIEFLQGLLLMRTEV